ncbi:hypothetical protein [Streptomyces mirabilis]|uniref:hypothetical protein n=1 Tax=Streptomyces mirabilis TaxID=68239 RepID=UPI0036D01A51
MAQAFVGAVAVVDQPFIEQVLQLSDVEAGLGFGGRPAASDIRAGVAGQVLAQLRVDGAEGALDDAFGGGAWGGVGWTLMPRVSQPALNAVDR